MNYSAIKPNDIADGEGVRVSLFVSGCLRHCKGCFNSSAWSFESGKPFTEEIQNNLLGLLDRSYINGLTLLGGDPFEMQNQRALLPFLERVKMQLPQKGIWAYTGYVLDEDLIAGGQRHCEATYPMLKLIDVLVDGPFMEELKDISLKFRGSSNQRIIDLKNFSFEDFSVKNDLLWRMQK